MHSARFHWYDVLRCIVHDEGRRGRSGRSQSKRKQSERKRLESKQIRMTNKTSQIIELHSKFKRVRPKVLENIRLENSSKKKWQQFNTL